MIMKMHSYMATNGYLRHASQQSTVILAQLREATLRVGGWEKAISDAKRRREDLEREMDTDSTGTGPSPSPSSGKLQLTGGDLSTSYVEVPSATTLRNRLIHATETETASETVLDDAKPKDITSHLLVNHPDPQISALATELSELDSELVSSGPERVRWPENITFKNFAVYQLIPSLVYELEYPRTKRYAFCHLDRSPWLTHIAQQNPSAVRFREDSRNLRHFCPALYHHGDVHSAIYESESRTVLRSDVAGLGLTVHAGIPSVIFHHIWCVRS